MDTETKSQGVFEKRPNVSRAEDEHSHDRDTTSINLGRATTVAGGDVVTFEEKVFSPLSVLGIGYSVTNSAMAILASLATAIGSGGPVSLIWGQIGIFLISLCFAVTLGELSSAMPNAAGQFYWVSQLAPRPFRRLLAFNTGFLGWASAVCISASGTLILYQMAFGMYILRNPDFVYQPWMACVGFQLTNFVIFFLTTVERFLPALSRASMMWSLCSLITIFVCILAASDVKQPASFVFGELINLSGWSDAVAVMTGLVGVNWGYSRLDACTHIAEEVPNPERNIPKALIATVLVGFLTAFPMTIAVLFSMRDVVDIILTPTMVPSLEVFVQASGGNTTAAIALQALIMVVFVGSIFGTHVWQARLCWTFARQGGLPMHQRLSKMAPLPFNTPFWAHLLSCLMVALLGFVYLGSITAFNSFVSGGLLFQNITYSMCAILLFMSGRSSFAHGPFWFPKLGPICHCITIIWTAYSLVIYSFPPYNPTTATNMNYVSVVVVGAIILANIGYFTYGRRTFVCL